MEKSVEIKLTCRVDGILKVHKMLVIQTTEASSIVEIALQAAQAINYLEESTKGNMILSSL
jgi:hypothetical protein